MVLASSYCTNESDITTDRPMCKTVDLMEANPFGFHAQANPCSNGTCDALSQCQYEMKTQGVATYGEGAYGPGGSLIDTNSAFTVRTELISKNDYVDLWKIRSRLTQGANEMVMESDCTDYITTMSDIIDGSMSLILSTWDGRGKAEMLDF